MDLLAKIRGLPKRISRRNTRRKANVQYLRQLTFGLGPSEKVAVLTAAREHLPNSSQRVREAALAELTKGGNVSPERVKDTFSRLAKVESLWINTPPAAGGAKLGFSEVASTVSGVPSSSLPKEIRRLLNPVQISSKDRPAATPITAVPPLTRLEQLVGVHLTNFNPLATRTPGVLYPLGREAPDLPRPTLHFALNGPIVSTGAAVAGSSWEGHQVAVISPIAPIAHQIESLSPQDTFVLGPVRLPEGSVILFSPESARHFGVASRDGTRHGRAIVKVISDAQWRKLEANYSEHNFPSPFHYAVYDHVNKMGFRPMRIGSHGWIFPGPRTADYERWASGVSALAASRGWSTGAYNHADYISARIEDTVVNLLQAEKEVKRGEEAFKAHNIDYFKAGNSRIHPSRYEPQRYTESLKQIRQHINDLPEETPSQRFKRKQLIAALRRAEDMLEERRPQIELQHKWLSELNRLHPVSRPQF